MKRSGDSTHHCRSPTPTLNGCELTPSTWTQSSEQECSYLTASKRRLSTPYSHNTPQSFSRGTRPYTFPRPTKHVCKSLACGKIRTGYHPALVRLFSRQLGIHSSLGGLAKRCHGSWFIHSSLPSCVWDNQFANLLAHFQNAMQLDAHESAKPSSVPRSSNSQANFSHLARI